MKVEEANSPAVAPQTPYASTQWASPIPIDPALQQQTAQLTPSPYAHYQSYAQFTATTQPAATSARQTAQSSPNTTDVATLNDALASGGVDLRAEEESLHRTYDQQQNYRSGWEADRTRKQPAKPNFPTHLLGPSMRSIATSHRVGAVPEDAVSYLALALRARLQTLLEGMIKAAAHRTDTQFDRAPSAYEDGTPMWSLVIRSDVEKQLAALEKVEREEEQKLRRERKEREDMAAAQAAALSAAVPGGAGAAGAASGAGGGEAMDEDGQPKKKKKKQDGPGVTARNMSEDVRKKMSNAVASQAAGLSTGKYAWMTAANAAAPGPAAKKTSGSPAPPGTKTEGGAPSKAATPAPAQAATAGGWARPYVSATQKAKETEEAKEEDQRLAVTLRDALFVIEGERGHGGGRGAARAMV